MGRILVTGAAGFLGSRIVDRWLIDKHHVIGIANWSAGSPDNIRHLQSERRFTFEQRDICKPFDPGYVEYVFNFA